MMNNSNEFLIDGALWHLAAQINTSFAPSEDLEVERSETYRMWNMEQMQGKILGIAALLAVAKPQTFILITGEGFTWDHV